MTLLTEGPLTPSSRTEALPRARVGTESAVSARRDDGIVVVRRRLLPAPDANTRLSSIGRGPCDDPHAMTRHTANRPADRTFATFCRDVRNRDAYDACLRVARHPRAATRLLVIDGPVGCGKTHLLRAIGSDVSARHPNARTVRLTAAKLLDQLAAAIVSGSNPTLLDHLSQSHLILIDDLFTLSGREFGTRAVGRVMRQWIDAGVRVVAASSAGAAQLAQLTEHVATTSSRHVTIRRPTECQILRILEQRSAAVAVRDGALRRIARQAHGDVGRALGMLTTASVRRMNGDEPRGRYSPLVAELIRTIHVAG